jgi:hypothetical protein
MTVRRFEDPCSECPASEECWNYGYTVATNERVNWFDCHKDIPEHSERNSDRNQAEAAPVLESDADRPAPTPRGSLPNSLGTSTSAGEPNDR